MLINSLEDKLAEFNAAIKEVQIIKVIFILTKWVTAQRSFENTYFISLYLFPCRTKWLHNAF